MAELTVLRGRTTVVPVSVPYDISQDIITSEIREGRSDTTPLIATWQVEFKTDGRDGEFVMRIDDSVSEAITHHVGFTDIKRVNGGEPYNIFEDPIQVIFKDPITE